MEVLIITRCVWHESCGDEAIWFPLKDDQGLGEAVRVLLAWDDKQRGSYV
jgi:hypothetical protein